MVRGVNRVARVVEHGDCRNGALQQRLRQRLACIRSFMAPINSRPGASPNAAPAPAGASTHRPLDTLSKRKSNA